MSIAKFSITVLALFASCNQSNKQRDIKKKHWGIKLTSPLFLLNKNQDSLRLTELVRKTYKWHEAAFKDQGDFSPAEKSAGDSLYRSIDWKISNRMVEKFRESGFFSTVFIGTYRAIALYIDKKLKDGTAKWRDGELPPFPGFESDPWCSCQDYPADNWDWNNITIKDLKINKGNANFIWYGGQDFTYKVGAIKENGVWKISSLEGFTLDKYVVMN